MVSNVGNTGNIKRTNSKSAQASSGSTSSKTNSVFNGRPKPKPVYKISKENAATLTMLRKMQNNAKKEFNKQLADDGWAGDLADGISALWGSKNRASKVRKDLNNVDNNLAKLNKAAMISDAEFEKVLKSIAGDYNQAAINAYKKNPTNENFKKAFPKLMNSTHRVAVYNKSQQQGTEAVKTTGKFVAGGAFILATGGSGLLLAGAATTVASVMIDESDRMHITGKHKDADGKTVKDKKGTFRAGTNHRRIFKRAAFNGIAVASGGAVGTGAKVVAAGSKALQIGLNVAGDVAVGAGLEYAETGNVSVSGALTNAAFSGIGSAASSGALKDGVKRIIRNFKGSTKAKAKYTSNMHGYEAALKKLKEKKANVAKTNTTTSANKATMESTYAAAREKLKRIAQNNTNNNNSVNTNANTASQVNTNRTVYGYRVAQPKPKAAQTQQSTPATQKQSQPQVSGTVRTQQPSKQTTQPKDNIGSYNETVPDYRLANKGKVPNTEVKTPISKGQEFELSEGKTMSLSTETYTARGPVRNEDITLHPNGLIQYRNGHTHQLKNGESYFYEPSPGTYKKVEYKAAPHQYNAGKAKVSDANKQEYDAFKKAEMEKIVAQSPVRSNISLAKIGNRTAAIPGTNYTVTGRPNGNGFIVKNKATGEEVGVYQGESITFKDGTTVSCTNGTDVALRISAKRNNI